MIIFGKQSRQVSRLPKNQTKATILACKQSLNEAIKKASKRKDLNEVVKTAMLKNYTKLKFELCNQ